MNNYKSLFTIGDDKDEKYEPSAICAERNQRKHESKGIVSYGPSKVSICCCYMYVKGYNLTGARPCRLIPLTTVTFVLSSWKFQSAAQMATEILNISYAMSVAGLLKLLY